MSKETAWEILAPKQERFHSKSSFKKARKWYLRKHKMVRYRIRHESGEVYTVLKEATN